MAGALIKILSDAQQEVPEFLLACGGGGGGGYSQSTFGGQDTRGGANANAGDDEDWG